MLPNPVFLVSFDTFFQSFRNLVTVWVSVNKDEISPCLHGEAWFSENMFELIIDLLLF